MLNTIEKMKKIIIGSNTVVNVIELYSGSLNSLIMRSETEQKAASTMKPGGFLFVTVRVTFGSSTDWYSAIFCVLCDFNLVPLLDCSLSFLFIIK